MVSVVFNDLTVRSPFSADVATVIDLPARVPVLTILCKRRCLLVFGPVHLFLYSQEHQSRAGVPFLETLTISRRSMTTISRTPDVYAELRPGKTGFGGNAPLLDLGSLGFDPWSGLSLLFLQVAIFFVDRSSSFCSYPRPCQLTHRTHIASCEWAYTRCYCRSCDAPADPWRIPQEELRAAG
jgi:hypothetical protein